MSDQFAMANLEDEVLNKLTLKFSEEYAAMDLDALVEICENMDLKLKEEDIHRIERATRDQSLSSLWFKLRAGRITASNFKDVCITSIDRPSKTTVKKICYPETNKLNLAATKYGKDNKDNALTKYKDEMNKDARENGHANYEFKKCGLHFNNEYPGFAASPNWVYFDDKKKILVHIKCPFSGKFDLYIKKTKNEKNEDKYVMIETHDSYYQVQMLIFMTESEEAHFVVWTPSDLIIVKVQPDKVFWKKNFAIAERFLRSIILPEMLGKKIIQQ